MLNNIKFSQKTKLIIGVIIFIIVVSISFVISKKQQQFVLSVNKIKTAEALDGSGVRDIDGVNTSYQYMEKHVHDLVNKKRNIRFLKSLKWNDELAEIARKHSANLARMNKDLINTDTNCSLPFITHEDTDLDFGLYSEDWVRNNKIYTHRGTGDNISMLFPLVVAGVSPSELPSKQAGNNQACQLKIMELHNKLQNDMSRAKTAEQKIQIIKETVVSRKDFLSRQKKINPITTAPQNNKTGEDLIVDGWMDSPGHRANILREVFNEAGVGIAEQKNYFFITQVFMARVDCGYQTGPCCNILNQNVCYDPFKCNNMVCE